MSDEEARKRACELGIPTRVYLEAVSDGREQAAKIADEYVGPGSKTASYDCACKDIAAAIRGGRG